MAMLVGGPGRLKAEMNITPMIDVLLVLMIIFMVILPDSSEGLRALAPQPASDAAKPTQESPLVITVIDDITVRLNQEEPVPIERLDAKLRDLFKTAANHVIFVRGEKEGLEYQYVARVIDIARGAGIEKVALMPR
jgi:biopolymer transport protein TolR